MDAFDSRPLVDPEEEEFFSTEEGSRSDSSMFGFMDKHTLFRHHV